VLQLTFIFSTMKIIIETLRFIFDMSFPLSNVLFLKQNEDGVLFLRIYRPIVDTMYLHLSKHDVLHIFSQGLI
jgi:hypothetical protein